MLIKWYRELWVTSLGSAAILAFTFFNLQSKISQMKSEMDTDLKDNPFKGFADVAMQSVQLQWGWAILVIGTGLLIATAAMSEKGAAADWSR